MFSNYKLNLGSSSTIVQPSYNAVSGSDVLNYQTGLALTNGLLANASNEWTGALNQFDQQIKNNNLQSAIENGSMLNPFYNKTGRVSTRK